MPIEVKHLPDYATVLEAARITGAGEFEQQRRREQMAMLELAQRDLAQRRAIEADQQRQALAFAANERDRNARFNLAGWEAALRQQNLLRGRAWEVEDRDFAAEMRGEERKAAGEEWDRRALLEWDRDWKMRGADHAEVGVGAELADLTKNHARLDPEGKRKLGDLVGKFRAIQANRAAMSPEAYANALNQFGNEMGLAGVRDHFIPEPDVKGEVAKRVVTMPNGKSYILQPNGEIRPDDPPKAQEAKSPADLMRAEKAKFADSWLGKTKDGPLDQDGHPTKVPVTEADLEEMWRMRQKFLGLDPDAEPTDIHAAQQPLAPGAGVVPIGQQPPPPMNAVEPIEEQLPPVADQLLGVPTQPAPAAQFDTVSNPPAAPKPDRAQVNQTAIALAKQIGNRSNVKVAANPDAVRAYQQLETTLKQVSNDDIRDLLGHVHGPVARKLVQDEIARRPPPGFDFPYGDSTKQPLPRLTDGELEGRVFRKGDMPGPGKMFIHADTGEVFLVLPNGRFKPVPPELL